MTFDLIMSILFGIITFVPCLAGYKYFRTEPTTMPSKHMPSQHMAEKVIQHDDDLLMRAKGALYDYRQNPLFAKKLLIKYREKLVNRYQTYKYMKRDNESQIPRRYMEMRMDEFFNLLQKLPPI